MRPLRPRGVCSQLMRCTQCCNAHSYQIDRKVSILQHYAYLHISQHHRAEECWAVRLCLVHHVLPTDCYFIRNLTDFLQGNTTMSRKCFQELLESGNMGFYATEINLFLTGRSVLTLIASINSFDYNDLKCTAWVCNSFYF